MSELSQSVDRLTTVVTGIVGHVSNLQSQLDEAKAQLASLQVIDEADKAALADALNEIQTATTAIKTQTDTLDNNDGTPLETPEPPSDNDPSGGTAPADPVVVDPDPVPTPVEDPAPSPGDSTDPALPSEPVDETPVDTPVEDAPVDETPAPVDEEPAPVVVTDPAPVNDAGTPDDTEGTVPPVDENPDESTSTDGTVDTSGDTGANTPAESPAASSNADDPFTPPASTIL